RGDEAALRKEAAHAVVALELRNETSAGEIDEATCGYRHEHIDQSPAHERASDQRNDGSQNRDSRRDEVEQQRPARRQAAANENGEAAELMRELMEQHGERRADAQGGSSQVARPNDEPIDEIVHAVAQ